MHRSALAMAALVCLASLPSTVASADRPAVTVDRGAELYTVRRCGACHDASPADAPHPDAPPGARSAPHVIRNEHAVARSQQFAGSRLQRGWIESFLLEPHEGGESMPGIEALSIARYLETRRDTVLVPEAPELEEVASDSSAVRAGRALYQQLACGSCHRMDGIGETIGPDLTGVGLELRPAYIAANLRDPQRLWPASEMPNFGLTGEQVRSLVAFLSAQQP